MNRRWSEAFLLGAAIGLVVGVGGYTFVYARGASYLTDNPGACANCHIMGDHLSGWIASSHRAVAVCNDCHTPQGILAKAAVKAANGFRHSWAFTTGRFPEPLRITATNRAVTERACRRCHQETVLAMEGPHPVSGALSCVRCHPSVGHLQ